MTSIKSPRPVANALVITQRAKDSTRSLHFRTDLGPVVIRIPNAELLREFADKLYEEAEEWEG
jgi:hypothetical protein